MIYILIIVGVFFVWKMFKQTQKDYYHDGFSKGFQEKERLTKINNLTEGFQETFTESQKKAILGSMFLMIIADKSLGVNKVKSLKTTADLLGFNLKSGTLDCIGNQLFDNVNDFYRTEHTLNVDLKSLSPSQKDWYILTIVGLMNADRMITESEFSNMIIMFNKIGISENRVVDVVEKASALGKFFNQ